MKAKTVDEYIAAFPTEVQALLLQVREAIRVEAPADAEEVISYQIPTVKWHGNLVHYAAFKGHLGFYPGPSAIEKFKAELWEFEGAKGSVRFPFTKPLPLKLIRKMVQFRAKENRHLAAQKNKSKKDK